MAVGPEDGEHGQEPEAAAAFKDGDEAGGENIGEDAGAVFGELDRERGGGQRRGNAPEPGAGALARDEAGESTEGGEQQRFPENHGGEAAGGVDQVPDGLSQPFVGEVEAAGGGFAGGRG